MDDPDILKVLSCKIHTSVMSSNHKSPKTKGWKTVRVTEPARKLSISSSRNAWYSGCYHIRLREHQPEQNVEWHKCGNLRVNISPLLNFHRAAPHVHGVIHCFSYPYAKGQNEKFSYPYPILGTVYHMLNRRWEYCTKSCIPVIFSTIIPPLNVDYCCAKFPPIFSLCLGSCISIGWI